MFASRKRIATAGADLFDLALEFATLGEYGLEYPEPGVRPANCGTGTLPRDCRTEHRGNRTTGLRRSRAKQARHRSTSGLPQALQPPRLRLECLEGE
jgi:hypothetical protein